MYAPDSPGDGRRNIASRRQALDLMFVALDLIHDECPTDPSIQAAWDALSRAIRVAKPHLTGKAAQND